jgi:hypothetical protein
LKNLPISARKILVAACITLAIALNLGLTRVGHQSAVTYCDLRFEVKRGPPGEPIITFGGYVADTFCVGQTSASERARLTGAFSEIYGIFPARNVPATIALWGGVLTPFAVMLFATYIALRVFLFPLRAIALLGLATLGILIATVVISTFILVPLGPPRFWVNYLWPLVISLGLFLGVYWLWRTRSPKQPA